MKRLCSWWGEIVSWWMGQKVEWYAGYGTTIYIGIIIMVMAARLDELFNLKLNEIGDFLAGAFGPVAFLWLILGYLQQGRELKLSSEALHLQVAEFRNSVEQQTHLVTVGREQIAAQTDALDHERRRYEKSMEANFIFSTSSKLFTNDTHIHTYDIINLGADAFDISASVALPDKVSSFNMAVMKRDQSAKLRFEYKDVADDHLSSMDCSYRTQDGRAIGFKMDCMVSAKTGKLSITRPIKAEDL